MHDTARRPQDHFKQLKKEAGFTREADAPPGPKLDLAFKAGQVSHGGFQAAVCAR